MLTEHIEEESDCIDDLGVVNVDMQQTVESLTFVLSLNFLAWKAASFATFTELQEVGALKSRISSKVMFVLCNSS